MSAAPSGECAVSSACYPPPRLHAWVTQRIAALPNLRVLLRTVVRGVVRDGDGDGGGSGGTGRVMGLDLVTRTPTATAPAEWLARLSDSMPDWYSPDPSANFTKVAQTWPASVVVDATELGDVLVTGNMPWTQVMRFHGVFLYHGQLRFPYSWYHNRPE